jgi:SAM-dependent methyltransferase
LTDAWAERARAAEAAYVRDPERGSGEDNPFILWVVARLQKTAGVREVVELGCGTGSDAVRLAREGYRVHGVDFAPTAIELATARRAALGEPFRSRLAFLQGEATQFLEGRPPASADAVVANLVYMTWSPPELARLVAAVHRVLRPGGLHLFSVRTTTDPNAGKGARVAPNTYLGGPHVVPYRYFTPDDVEELSRPGFDRVERLGSRETHRLFVADGRREAVATDGSPPDRSKG